MLLIDMYVWSRVLDAVLKRDIEIRKGKDESLITLLVNITINLIRILKLEHYFSHHISLLARPIFFQNYP